MTAAVEKYRVAREQFSREAAIWRRYDDMERRLTAAISERMLDLAGLGPGMHVLDIATGRGEPAIPAAHRVSPTGSVLGVDVSEAMLQMAGERADAEGVTNLKFRTQDTETLTDLPLAHFDAALARWGLMYFSSPVAAMRAICAAIVPRGVFVAAVWAEPERVSYFTLPRNVLARYAPVPAIDFEAPGVFRYADVDRMQRDFSAAGFMLEHIEEHYVDLMVAETDSELIEWARAFGMERLLKDVSPEIRSAWAADFAREARALSGSGRLRLGGVTRIVVARSGATER